MRLTTVNDTPHGTGEGGSHTEPAIVEDLHGHFEPITGLAEDVLHGDGDVVKIYLGCVGASTRDMYSPIDSGTHLTPCVRCLLRGSHECHRLSKPG